MSKIDTSSLPALTASRWSPSAVIATEAWLPSSAEVPRPPVETVSSWLGEPFAARERDDGVAGRRVRLDVDVPGRSHREHRAGVRQRDDCERQRDDRGSNEFRDTRHA
jgi:hypothetical protein